MSVHKDNIEMEKAPTYAPSLPVPNVQEMVKMNPLEVPTKYVRNEEEIEKVNYMPQLSSEIPVIDFTLLSNGSMEELLKLEIACKDWGFFHVIPQLQFLPFFLSFSIMLFIPNLNFTPYRDMCFSLSHFC